MIKTLSKENTYLTLKFNLSYAPQHNRNTKQHNTMVTGM